MKPRRCRGAAASAVVALSLTMRNLKRLRIVNLAGSAVFAVYGALIAAEAAVPAHAAYLRKLGFREVGRTADATLFRKERA